MSQEEIPKLKPPARPPQPDPWKLRTLRLSRLTVTDKVQDQTCNLGPESQNLPTYLEVLSNRSPTKDGAPARPPPPAFMRLRLSQNSEAEDLNGHTGTAEDIGDTEISCPNTNFEGTVDGLTDIDVLPHESGLRDLTTTGNTPPPRPVRPPRLSLTQPRKHLLCQSRSIDPTQHVYESIDDVMTRGEGGERGLPAGLTRKWRFATSHSLSEMSIVYSGRSTQELDILLEWWRSIGGLESLTMDYEDKETETKPLISVAQRIKTAMRLYELLLVQRCTDLLNHITELHCTADSLIKSKKKARVAKLTGGTTGAVGGVTIAAGLALAPLTFGASLVATGVGIGFVAAGGVAGASASFSKNKKGNKLKDKVEKILNSYKAQIEDILACLRFIQLGMEQLRKQDKSKLEEMGTHLEKIGGVAQEMQNIHSVDVISECFGTLEDLDCYFLEEEDPRTRRNSNTQLAQKVHEVANKLKECMDQLIRIKKLFLSVDDNI